MRSAISSGLPYRLMRASNRNFASFEHTARRQALDTFFHSIMRWVEEDAVMELAGRLRGSASKDIRRHSPRTGLASPALFQDST